MKTTTVQKIILPYKTDIPLSPSVLVNDKITRAIQVMLEFDLDHLAVVRNHKPIGMVKLEDALQSLGIQSGNRRHSLKHIELRR